MILLIFTLILGAKLASAEEFQRNLFNHRIVGGVETEEYEFPFMCSLRYYGSHMCGCSIINEEWILTAAHCAEYNSANYQVKAGLHGLNDNNVTKVQTFDIKQIILHPGYNTNTLSYDCAMMKIDGNFTFNEYVNNTANYCKQGYKPDDFPGNATVIGWGAISEGGGVPVQGKLQKVTVPLVSNAACSAAYDPPYPIIEETMICAGIEGKDSCQGDSGGPMMCDCGHCGIVSWGIGCARDGYPGVYARTSGCDEFIDNCTKGIVPPCSGFQCESDGKCIPANWECDEYYDCADGTDEHDDCIPCQHGYLCSDFLTCIPSHWECDNYYDCPDGNDEKDCACADYEYECDDKKCIHFAWTCDGHNDCCGGDDEGEELCSYLNTTTTSTTTTPKPTETTFKPDASTESFAKMIRENPEHFSRQDKGKMRRDEKDAMNGKRVLKPFQIKKK